MRILGLDYGSKTMGVAVSDPLCLTARALEIIRRERESHMRGTLRRIDELVKEYGVSEIVLGYPLNMDDTVGERAEKSEELAEVLRNRTQLPVTLIDERLTTVEAIEIMDEVGISRADRPKYVDMIAAQIILQSYLDSMDKTCNRGSMPV